MKVLIPIDGSEPSENTVAWAAQFFQKGTTEFFLLMVIPKTVPELALQEYEIEDALAVLKKFDQLLTDKGQKVAKAEYMSGDPASTICAYATEMGIEQIVMGSHGRTGLSKILLGSVSSAVFENAKQPVFVYRNTTLSKTPA